MATVRYGAAIERESTTSVEVRVQVYCFNPSEGLRTLLQVTKHIKMSQKIKKNPYNIICTSGTFNGVDEFAGMLGLESSNNLVTLTNDHVIKKENILALAIPAGVGTCTMSLVDSARDCSRYSRTAVGRAKQGSIVESPVRRTTRA